MAPFVHLQTQKKNTSASLRGYRRRRGSETYGELPESVWDLLEENGDEACVHLANAALGREFCESGDETRGIFGIRDEADSCRFKWSEQDVCEEPEGFMSDKINFARKLTYSPTPAAPR